MSSLQRTKAWLGTARYLARHPRETRRLPRWFPQRSLSPMAIRMPWWPYDAVTWMAGHLPPGARVEVRRGALPVRLARVHAAGGGSGEGGQFTDRLVAKFGLPVAGWRGRSPHPG